MFRESSQMKAIQWIRAFFSTPDCSWDWYKAKAEILASFRGKKAAFLLTLIIGVS